MRWRTPVLILALAIGPVAAADVTQGEVRSVQARDGVVLREAAKALAKSVATLPYGTRVRVTDVASFYAKVRTDEGVEGWLRASDVVAPSALTGGGSAGPVEGARVASSDLSAAGRQFDEGTEGKYRASAAQLDAAYRLVDALEQKGPRPDSAEVEEFVRTGRLGRQP